MVPQGRLSVSLPCGTTEELYTKLYLVTKAANYQNYPTVGIAPPYLIWKEPTHFRSLELHCNTRKSAIPRLIWTNSSWSRSLDQFKMAANCRNYPTVGIAPPYLTVQWPAWPSPVDSLSLATILHTDSRESDRLLNSSCLFELAVCRHVRPLHSHILTELHMGKRQERSQPLSRSLALRTTTPPLKNWAEQSLL